jgi:hypothetical protein
MNRKEAADLNPLVGNRPEETSDRIKAVLALVQVQSSDVISSNKQTAAGLYYVSDFVQKAKRFEINEAR